MDSNEINELIDCLKRITHDSNSFYLPEKGSYDQLDLKSNKSFFIVDVNRKGRKKPQFTLQLRDKEHKDCALLRLDMIGPPHKNPEGDFPFAGEIIECPHLHIAHPDYGSSIAYPLNNDYAKIYLTDAQIMDLVLILKMFLERCNVGNIDDIHYEYQQELI